MSTFQPVRRRSLLKGVAAAGLGGAIAVAIGRPAQAGDHGTVTWQPPVRGVPINGLAFRFATGDDDLRGPNDLLPASSISATVVVDTQAGRASITRQLNRPDEGWANRSVHDTWLSFAGIGLRTIVAENIRSFQLHFTPNQGGLFGDNWSMAGVSVFYPNGDRFADPPFTATMNGANFISLCTGSGQPWLHRFKENFDDEGGPDMAVQTNPFWNNAALQRAWRWCNRCQGLFFGGNGTSGACPLGGGHNPGGSANYLMPAYTAPQPREVQSGWRWCNRCQSLFFVDLPGRCPLGGSHASAGSSAYTMYVGGANTLNRQVGWRACAKCQGMWFAGNNTAGACPAGGGHDASRSWQYSIAFSSREP